MSHNESYPGRLSACLAFPPFLFHYGVVSHPPHGYFGATEDLVTHVGLRCRRGSIAGDGGGGTRLVCSVAL